MKIVIVVPTYNEAENIKRLLSSALEACKKVLRHECFILVVDGNSPDGTGKIVSNTAAQNPNILLLPEREKGGLGAAYIYGFKYAMETIGADVVMEMDADFQHNPNDIPRFIDQIDKGYDYVIGSRFVKGGSIPKSWSLDRKILSVGGSIFSKIVLGIFEVSDFTSGFKASRVKGYLDRLDLDSVRSKGFAYKIDLLFKMHKLGAKIVELPIEFGVRDRGDSKMESNNFVDSLRVVLAIRINENKEFIKFLCVGSAGFVTDALLFNVLRITVFDPALSAIASGLVAMLVTYTLNNVWSFGERRIAGLAKTLVTFVVYCSSSIIPIIVRSQLVDLFVKAFGHSLVPANTGFLIGIVFGLVWNYIVYSKIIWRKVPDRN
ncbi:TPA: glycosyltransferase family 2 protein [candidate division WWE3 bacterium]|uniref:Dolichyl-phosphate beta-D-mannosyltransferase n=4 Tax=Katanobacteria TaxID=422282 RepID=A0A0G1MWR1_UNCKA|nr:MAG: Dolichyl-phosphate beta-D-mannosyltransferase [candidate division WWE3 bacterium GW2011_GWA2_44_16]KKT85212.1 MAG: Dolichyl-phosphate beta-D-mannosyltransferase [candidate division WWE3 bacterium GW2011_GWC2_44_9]OGC52452.1 MAG: hypothetical protein A2709_01045 [candidate division WWE3 bacterium RIFCSPHIGHO2_01_FULL_43_9]HAZ29385.1 glycosyltransferase family 2 protein [candidate division WWE3 bacterium]